MKEEDKKTMSAEKEVSVSGKQKQEEVKAKPKCGIVMPISSIDGCSSDHWKEVLSIIKDAICPTGFETNLVSEADDVGIIQRRIIQNLYSNEIIVCDVSCKNPNVMFELGIRLAFDKPTVIVKDDKTDYTFDTSVIEHLTYPRDLRFAKILNFKELLEKKVRATYEKSLKENDYSPFLKSFGEYKVAKLTEKEVTSDRAILETLDRLSRDIAGLKFSDNDRRLNPVRLPSDYRRKMTTEEILRINFLVEKFLRLNDIRDKRSVLDNAVLYGELEKFIRSRMPERDFSFVPLPDIINNVLLET